jgi:hypothetical protein
VFATFIVTIAKVNQPDNCYFLVCNLFFTT